jgi:CubicO group peptidase (beta-lactamase class C family)
MVNENFMTDPTELGISSENLDELRSRVAKEVREGLLPSAQFALARNGKLAAFETFGNGSNDSLYCIFSSTKAMTSAAAWLLIQEGRFDIHRKVSELIPEFASNGKEDITIEQLFTHTAGFPAAPFRPTDWNDKARRIERFASWRLNWEPGSRYEYHPTSSMWIIAELIERISGETYQDFVRNHIALPLGLDDLWVGCPPDQHRRIAKIMHVGEAMTSEDYARLGIPEPPVTEVTEDALAAFNTAPVREVGVPGGGGIMTAADLALFYQGLMGNLEEKPWRHQTLVNALAVRTGGIKDQLSGIPVNRALGVVVAGDDQRNMRGFGHTNSPGAFGHGGAGGQIAWADPESGLSFAYVTNGHDRNAIRQGRRGVSLSNRAAVCVA